MPDASDALDWREDWRAEAADPSFPVHSVTHA
jgi:hypothetical protein